MIEFTIADLPDQQWSVVLNNRRVDMRLRYNGSADRWYLDITLDDLLILVGRRVTLGVDLLEAFSFDLGVIFAVPNHADDLPTREALPAGTVKLYHATEEEVEEALAS